MRKVLSGKLVTINYIRASRAKKTHATIGCSIIEAFLLGLQLTTPEERRHCREKDITTYRTTSKTSGLLSDKYPGVVEGQKLV